MLVNDEVINNLKKLKDDNSDPFKLEIEKISSELFNEHCSKTRYKSECDPYCADAFTDTCQYLKEMRKLWNVFGREP